MAKMKGEKAEMINKARAFVPEDPRRQAAAGGKGSGSRVGNEMKADLKGAMEELKTQHPIHYSERGPHHGMKHHVRHEPVVKGYGR